MKYKVYDYYKAPGVRELCQNVKQSDDWHKQRTAIEEMAVFFIEQDILNDKSVIVPAPQHTGKAEYTREIADILCKEAGAYVFDVLYCDPREPLYEQKKKGGICDAGINVRDILNAEDIMNFDFDNRSQDFFFLDNVMGTGNTYQTALRLFNTEYGCYFKPLLPLVYAIDSKRISHSLSNILHFVRRCGEDEKTISIDSGGSFDYWSCGDRNDGVVR